MREAGRKIRRAAAFGLAVALAAPAGAATVDYTSFHILGDSLSDVGNVWRNSRKVEPKSPPYYRGRFSNGPVWADRVAGAFRDADLPTGNHAWGGAEAIGEFLDVPDLSRQASIYRTVGADRRGDRPLIAMFIGGNDILNGAGKSGIRGVGRRAAAEVGEVADGLGRTGARDFLLFTLPDIGAIPKFGDDPDDARSARRGSLAFNRELKRQASTLRDDGRRVKIVDTFALFEALLADPKAFGVRNVTTPCLDDGDACTRKQGKRRAFFDEIHPNRVVHRRIAEAAMAKIDGGASARMMATSAVAPVPLPPAAALLVAAVLALAGLRATSAGRAGRGLRRAG